MLTFIFVNNQNFIQPLEKAFPNYIIKPWNYETDFIPYQQNSLVLASSDKELTYLSHNHLPTIAYGTPNDTNHLFGSDYLVDSLEELDSALLETVFCRYHHIPLTIAKHKDFVLREIAFSDLDSLWQLYDKERNNPSINWFPFSPENKTERELFYQYISDSYRFYQYGLWGVFSPNTNILMGHCGIVNSNIENDFCLELCYFIGDKFRRKHLAFHACQSIIDYCKKMKLTTMLYVRILKDNTPSIGLASTLGFSMIQSLENYDLYGLPL